MLDSFLHIAPLRRVGYVDMPGEGFIVWRTGTGGECEICWLKVRESGKGVGTRLLKEMLRTLKSSPPPSSVYGFTWRGNEAARRFYESMGFDLTEVKGVYRDGSAVLFSQYYDVLCRRLTEGRGDTDGDQKGEESLMTKQELQRLWNYDGDRGDWEGEMKRRGCHLITHGWKESGDDQFVALLRQYGFTVLEDPSCAGSDTVGFVIIPPKEGP